MRIAAGVMLVLGALGSTACGHASGIVAPTVVNTAPAVSVAFRTVGTCTPKIGTPCSVDVLALATDTDNDTLRYSWSGCATGSSSSASCLIEWPGPVIASVDVNDDHGHVVTGTLVVVGSGSNQPPGVQIGYATPFQNTFFELLGNVIDPDEGFLCGRQYCVSAAASGACSTASLQCTCLAGLESSVKRVADSGTCKITFTLKDSWGQVGTPSVSFDVNDPGTRVITPGSIGRTLLSAPGIRAR